MILKELKSTGFFLMLIISFFACKTKETYSVAGYYKNETECLDNRLDGSLILKAWGRGKNEHDGVEQAKKNALKDVLFNGIKKNQDYIKPLIIEVNAETKYEDYWNKFFSTNGLYLNFVSLQKGVKKTELKSGEEVTYGIMVRVLRQNLKKQLLADNILKN